MQLQDSWKLLVTELARGKSYPYICSRKSVYSTQLSQSWES